MHVTSDLPVPTADARAHSDRLTAHIAARIERAGGWIDFAEYMALALYAPGLGYYSAGAAKFGAAGDFVTAPEVSPLFGRCVARAVAPALAARPGARMLELGAGSGALAAGVLQALADAGAVPERYYILEVSADLRARQRALIATLATDLAARVEWLDGWPEPFDGVVLANEVVDALACTRFTMVAGKPRALGVTLRNGQFEWAGRPAGAALAEYVTRIESALGTSLPDGYTGEVRLELGGFVASLADVLRDGACLLIDYGLPRRELYAPSRADGTLRCHYRHRAHDDPFFQPGLQDITAWVDFTALARAASDAGLRVDGYTTQARFLIAAGIETEFMAAGADATDTAARVGLSRAMQMLLMPGQMGERFKVLWLGRGARCTGALFDDDERHRL